MKKITLVLLLSALTTIACFSGCSEDDPECTNGTWKCDNNILIKCMNEKWKVQHTFQENTLLNEKCIVTLGHYEQDNNTSNGKEPIQWRILAKNDKGNVLVISENVLDIQQYNKTERDITWETSTIRSWLNGYTASYNIDAIDYTNDNFIDTAFDESEQSKIVTSRVFAQYNPVHSLEPDSSSITLEPDNSTTDKLFLLSVNEARNYFINDQRRKARATQYATEKGVSLNYHRYENESCTEAIYCYAAWWLRTPGAYVAPGYYYTTSDKTIGRGDISSAGNNVTIDRYGVRPAMWLDYELFNQ